MTTNNDNMVRDEINNEYTEVNDDKNSNDVNNDQKEDISEEEAVAQIVKTEKSMYNNFLDYDRRAKEGEFLLNQYFNNPKLTTLCKYLWFNCTATCVYLYRYKTISNLLNENKRNKTFLVIKHIIYITYAVAKMLLVSITLFTMRLAISTAKLVFYICELILCLPICMLFSKEIELINKRFNNLKSGEKNSNSNKNNKSNKNSSIFGKYWKNIKWYFKNVAGYVKYVFAKITGKVNTSKKIVRPTLNLALLKRKKISFIKKILIRVRHWTKLKMFNLRLINIVDNNKNKIRKRNAKNQLKYVKKVLDDYRKGRKTKKSKAKIQGKKKNSIKNARRQIRKSNKPQNIKDKLIQKITELATKTKKLEFLGEKILFNTLFVKITKSLVQEKDLQTNLTKSQKAQYDRYSKVEEEKKNTKKNEIKNKENKLKENQKENQKEKENNPKNKIKENVKIENLKGVKSENRQNSKINSMLENKNIDNKKYILKQEADKEKINKFLDNINNNTATVIDKNDFKKIQSDLLWEDIINGIGSDQSTQTSQTNDNNFTSDNNKNDNKDLTSKNNDSFMDNKGDNNENNLKGVKTHDNNSIDSNDLNNKGSVKKMPSKGGLSL